MSKGTKQQGEWVSVKEYAKRMKVKSTQLIYERIAKGKLIEGVEWRNLELKINRKQMFYKNPGEIKPIE